MTLEGATTAKGRRGVSHMPYRLIVKTPDNARTITNNDGLSRKQAWDKANAAATANPNACIRIIRTDARRPGEACSWEWLDERLRRTNNVPIPPTFWKA